MEKPYEGKAKINITAGYCEIIMPAKRPVLIILFLTVWLVIWGIGIISVITMLIQNKIENDPQPFMFIWSTLAMVISLIALRKWIWMVLGKEVITFERNELKIQRKNLIPFKTKTYDLKEVKNINTQVYIEEGLFDSGSKRNFYKAFTQGTILFDYGMKTIQMGESIHEGEARTIISLLLEKGIIKEEQIFVHINQNVKNKHWGPL